ARRERLPRVAQPARRARARGTRGRPGQPGAIPQRADHQGGHRPVRGDARMNAHRPQTKFPQERLMSVLLAPIISEKATFIADKHEQVVFRVAQDATKPEVKAAVELMFKVEVEKVQI